MKKRNGGMYSVFEASKYVRNIWKMFCCLLVELADVSDECTASIFFIEEQAKHNIKNQQAECSEDGGGALLRSVRKFIPVSTSSRPRR
jgi:hypothetical protein